MAEHDSVKHPNHYCKNGIECIDAIKAAVSGITDPFEAYCAGNIVKYAWRWNEKNGIEDLKKAKQYADFIVGYRDTKDNPEPTDKPSKWEGLSNFALRLEMCKRFSPSCQPCPMRDSLNGTGKLCPNFMRLYPTEARKLMLDFLKSQEATEDWGGDAE